MDVSKLPKLSQSPPPPPEGTEPPPSQQSAPGEQPYVRPAPAVPDYAPPAGTVGAEVFFSLIIAVIAIFFGKNFLSFLAAAVTGKEYVTGLTYTTTGLPVPYSDAGPGNMLTDLGILLVGLMLLLDAGARVMRKKWVITIAFFVSACTALLNAYAAVRIWGYNIMPLWSVLCLALSGYFAITQFAWLKSTKPPHQIGRAAG